MTRRKRRPEGQWTAADNAAQTRVLAAADRYREKFGEPAPTWEFMGHPREPERELNAAIERGETVMAAQLYKRIGIAPPPGVLL